MSSHKRTVTLLYFVLIIFSILSVDCQLQTVQMTVPQSDVMVSENIQQVTQQKLLSQNTDFLVGQSYKGTYYSLQSTNLFEYLDTTEGDIQAVFYNDQLKVSSTSLNSLQIFLFNPKYHDLKAVGLLIDLDQMKEGNKWQQKNVKIKMQKFWKGRSYQDQQVIDGVNYTVQVANIDSQDETVVQIIVEIHGPNFNFSSKMDYYHDFLSTMGYSLYTTLVVGAQIACAIAILKQIDRENPAILAKMSLFTLSVCNIEDFYLTMLHIQYIMSSGTAYLLFVLPAIAYLVLFVIFDMKMLFLVWRSHHMRNIENAQVLRKKLTVFYIQFYLGLFVYLTLNYFFEYESWLIFVQHLILIPQIVHNVRKGNNPGFSAYYVLGFLGLRYLIPLYQRGCPGNHFVLQPMPVLVSILAALYIIQIAILYLQHRWGPRFFVPKFLLPNYYNYNVKLKIDEQNKDIDCSICLLNIFCPQPVTGMVNESMVMHEHLLEEISIMKTPCNHYFHKQCLGKWIDVKLQCPTCRKPLPAI